MVNTIPKHVLTFALVFNIRGGGGYLGTTTGLGLHGGRVIFAGINSGIGVWMESYYRTCDKMRFKNNQIALQRRMFPYL